MKVVNEATDYAEEAPYAAARTCNESCICRSKGGMNNGNYVLYRCDYTCDE